MSKRPWVGRVSASGGRGLAALLPALGTAAAVFSVSGAAIAQNAIPDSNGSGMDTHLFRPAMDSKGLFTINGSEVLPKDDFSFGLVVDYGRTLMRVNDVGQQSAQLIN